MHPLSKAIVARPSPTTSTIASGVALATGLVLNPIAAAQTPSDAATLGKDVLTNVILGDLRSQLAGALDQMGCRGTALASMTGTDVPGRSGTRAGAPAAGGAGPATATGGLPRPAGLPSGGNIMPKPAGSVAAVASSRAAQPAGGGGDIDPAMLALMLAMMETPSSGGAASSGDQAAGLKGAIAAIEQAMAKPLTRAETAAMFPELADLGIITPVMAGEARDCVLQASPAAVELAGVAASVLKHVLIPRLANAKARLSNLSRAEQDALVEAMIRELRNAPASDRAVFFDGYGRGFYPTQIVERVKSRL